jgi:hypothetical protein
VHVDRDQVVDVHGVIIPVTFPLVMKCSRQFLARSTCGRTSPHRVI